jgi:hypothetical protein
MLILLELVSQHDLKVTILRVSTNLPHYVMKNSYANYNHLLKLFILLIQEPQAECSRGAVLQ